MYKYILSHAVTAIDFFLGEIKGYLKYATTKHVLLYLFFFQILLSSVAYIKIQPVAFLKLFENYRPDLSAVMQCSRKKSILQNARKCRQKGVKYTKGGEVDVSEIRVGR